MKKANPAAIGAFVLGAVALAIAGVVLLASGALFRETQRFVLFPETSVNGLRAGSPVKIVGVEVGTVLEVNAIADQQRTEVLSEVVIEIDPARLKRIGTVSGIVASAERLVEKGLRARLELQSLVTGQLYVGFDFYPDQPVILRGIPSPYPELPVIRSLTEEFGASFRDLMTRLRDMPLEEIAQNLDHTLAGIGELVNSPDAQRAVAELPGAVAELRGAAAEARKTLASVQELVGDMDARVDPVVDSAVAALEQARETLETVEDVAGQGTEIRYELTQALTELRAAARAIRRLADYVERNPNSVVFGRSSGEK